MEPENSGDGVVPCSCAQDGFGALSPELWPQQESSLRQVTCPECGLVYWTNHETDLCMECERKHNADRN